MRRSWRFVAIAAFILAVLLGGAIGNRVMAVTDETRERLRLYTELVEVVQERYGGEVSYRDLVYASIQGMLRTLDPHTNFLSAEAYASMRDRQQASFYGLGILVGMRNGLLTVISPLDGTPASRLGIRAGDIISTIDGQPTETLTLDEAVQKLKGPKDTQVKISIVRRGLEAPLELEITRAEIPQTTVRYAYMIEPGTGYILISDFARSTGAEVARAIEGLKAQGMQRLLVDLRNNGGGLLDQAIEVADQFLPKDSRIVETRGRTKDSFQKFDAAGDHPHLDIPVVVLVNAGTASAAEILSGAIQDHDMGMIVGTPTWGKGLVQTVYGLSYGAGLALTTAKYYTPSGRLIQRDYSSYFDYYYARGEDDATPVPPVDPAGEYATDLGRKVYGGGGITPDVLASASEPPAYVQYLLARNAFFDFAVDYTRQHKVPAREWRPEPTVLQQFADWLVSEKIGSREEVDKGLAEPAASEFSLRQIRAEALNGAFGLEAGHQALTAGDDQIQAALKLFDRAAALLASRQEQAKPPATTGGAPLG